MANRSTIRKKQGHDMAAYNVTPGNFWEIGNYMRTVKRINESNLFCDDLIKMFTERADIESKYSKRLSDWHEKWTKLLETSCMYATMKTASLGALKESKDRSIIHMDCWTKIHNQTVETIKRHKESNYHKGFAVGLKEAKEYEEDFAKAQKPWAVAFGKVQRAKKNYHSACKQREVATQNLSAANKDSEVPIDKIKKLEDAVRKSENNVNSMKKKYEEKLTRIEPLNSTYESEMRSVYSRWEKDETARKDFLQQTLVDFHKAVNILEDKRLSECFDNQLSVAYSGKTKYDVQWYSENYGVDMTRPWPKFEDYSKCDGRIPWSHGLTSNDLKTIRRYKTRARPHPYKNSIREYFRTPRKQTRRFTLPIRRMSQSPRIDSYSSDTLSSVSFNNELAKIQSSEVLKTVDEPYSYHLPLQQRTVTSSSSLSLPTTFGYKNGDDYDDNLVKQATSRSRSLDLQSYVEKDSLFRNEFTTAQEFGTVPETPYNTVSSVEPPASYNNTITTQNSHTEVSSYQPAPDPESNPFMNGPEEKDGYEDDDDWDMSPPVPVPGGGIPVRALYDYTKVEDDELSFKAGDILTKLTEEDQQGWCRGKLNDVEGLYPANYVEPI